MRYFNCKRCGKPVRYHHVQGNLNSNAVKLSRLRNSINSSRILRLKPNVGLCMKCSQELDAWGTTEFTRASKENRARIDALINRSGGLT